MNIADIIKQAREDLGLTQEDLAEKLEVSRQAVSKWELGASVPSPENLALLEEVLGVEFPAPEEAVPQEAAPGEAVPQPAPKAPFWNWKRVVILVLGVLIVSALLSIVMFETLRADTHTDAARHRDPYITDIAFFDEDAAPLRPGLGDGWYHFAPERKVLMAVEFQDGLETGVDAVSLFLTPAGTETFDLRQQLAVQAVPDGRHLALFALHIPKDLMGHLDIVLGSGGVQTVAETLNVAAEAPDADPLPGEEGPLVLSAADITIGLEDSVYPVLEVLGAPVEDVAWISADPDIAGVSTTGMVWGVSPGVTTVTAEWEGRTAECRVRVFAEAIPTDESGVSVSE
nr:helix-turn-helix domain-containing protein [uncultured Oscillibacter sp.]